MRATLQTHWAASDAGDFDAQHAIYDGSAILDYPQSGERIRGRERIQASRRRNRIPNASRYGAFWEAAISASES